MSTLDERNEIEVDDLDLLLFEDEDEESLQSALDPTIGLEKASSVEEDRPIEFLDERFSLDQELRLSGEQRLKLEIIRSLKEPCDRLTYGKRLTEAAKKLGKSERTIRRLIKAWQDEGLQG